MFFLCRFDVTNASWTSSRASLILLLARLLHHHQNKERQVAVKARMSWAASEIAGTGQGVGLSNTLFRVRGHWVSGSGLRGARCTYQSTKALLSSDNGGSQTYQQEFRRPPTALANRGLVTAIVRGPIPGGGLPLSSPHGRRRGVLQGAPG